jgi:hypothetical protein
MRLDGMIQAGRLRIYDATPDDMPKVVAWLNAFYYARFA